MSSVLVITGSPARRSRSSALADAVAARLAAKGISSGLVTLNDVPADDLIYGRWDGLAARRLAARVAEVDALVVSTPVYKASFSGGLKALLDLLPERSFANKIVLPMATGGSLAHLLAVEYALKPVLSALGARHILSGVFAHEAQLSASGDDHVYQLSADVEARIDESVEHLTELLEHVEARRRAASNAFVERQLQARCSA